MSAAAVPLSVLDLAYVPQGSSIPDALRRSRDLAQNVERLGYHRFWLAEHHNAISVASAATSVLIGYVAEGTSTIRVGAGGVMLPNHAPLVIAEQFGTLASLYPGRIDLGLGRAPGTDQVTMQALRRGLPSVDSFPRDVQELRAYFGPEQPGQRVRAIPGIGTEVPLWILGSSLYGAELAALLGLPYAFASHFAPDALLPALEMYRAKFEPSEQLSDPYAMVAVNVLAADTDTEARRLFTSQQQAMTGIVRGNRGLYPPPLDDPAGIDSWWSEAESFHVGRMLRRSYVGDSGAVADGLRGLLAETAADELIIATGAYRQEDRIRSYELLANSWSVTSVSA